MILGGYFDEDVKLERIKDLEAFMNEPGFWDDTSRANRVNQELTHLKKELKGYHDARGELEIILELLELEDESFNEEIKNNLEKLTKEVDSLEVSLLLSNDYDELNCFLEIHPGAGGTESCDFANMLLEMYEKGEFKALTEEEYIEIVCEIISILPREMVIHRLTGDGNPDELIAPLWSLRKLQVLNGINHRLKELDIIQGIKS